MNNKATILTYEYLHEAFSYKEGKLFWKNRPLHHFASSHSQKIFNKRQGLTEAGTTLNGYRQIYFSVGKIASHRIIFMMHHAYLPPEIDHIDGNPGNNLIENLRAATHSQNLKNSRTYKANKTGFKGVCLHKTSGKFFAFIFENGKQKHLGSFKSAEEAAIVRKAAEKKYYGNFANER